MARTETLRVPGWVDGLNREADPLQIENSELAEALNVDIGLLGAVSKRKGYTRYDSNLTTTKLTAIHTWGKLGAAEFLIGVDAALGDIVYSSGDAFSVETTGWGDDDDMAEWPIAFASLNDILYVSSLRGNTWKFDGTTWAELTDTTLDASGTEFPQARFLVSLHERIFAFNVIVNAGRYRSRMYYSQPADAETWDELDWVDIQPDDGQEITAAVAFGENIIIFKNHAIHLLSGADEDSFTRYPVDSKIGTESPGTVVPDGNNLYFFDYKSGVWTFNGSSFDRISDKVNTYLLEGINVGQHHKAHAFVWEGKYYLSVPWGSDEFNSRTFVYDTRTESWSEYDMGVFDTTEKDRRLFGVSPADKAGVHEMFDGLTDAGDAIAAHFRTGWISPKSPALKHRLKRTDMAFSALADTDVTIELYRDFVVDPYVAKSVNTAPGGMTWGTSLWGENWGSGVEQVFVRETGWGKRWRTIAFKFSEDAPAGDLQVNSLALHITSLGSVRGSGSEGGSN